MCNCSAHRGSFTQSSACQDVGNLPPALSLDHHMFDCFRQCWYFAQTNLADFKKLFQCTQATTGVYKVVVDFVKCELRYCDSLQGSGSKCLSYIL